MDADYDIFEIVNVIRDFWLIDAESYQRAYCTKQGQPVAPGYYVVNWPDHIRVRRFNEHAIFHGPFNIKKQAQTALNELHKERVRVLKKPSEKLLAITPRKFELNLPKIESQNQQSMKTARHRHSLTA